MYTRWLWGGLFQGIYPFSCGRAGKKWYDTKNLMKLFSSLDALGHLPFSSADCCYEWVLRNGNIFDGVCQHVLFFDSESRTLLTRLPTFGNSWPFKCLDSYFAETLHFQIPVYNFSWLEERGENKISWSLQSYMKWWGSSTMYLNRLYYHTSCLGFSWV